MRATILFPADFFDLTKADSTYENEYKAAAEQFNVLLFNYDDFISGGKLKLYPKQHSTGLCIYRGWMLKTEQYRALYEKLSASGLSLVNTPEQYEYCHEFPNVYPVIRSLTPEILVYPDGQYVDWSIVRNNFNRFIIKDYVKSVNEQHFLKVLDTAMTNEELDGYLRWFKELRGELYTKGIVLKKFVNFAKIDGMICEYRVFYFKGFVLSVSAHTNHLLPNGSVPKEFLSRIPKLSSQFYTVDFAQLDDGSWTVIETGDGQVSGLDAGIDIRGFYSKLYHLIEDLRY